MKKHGGILEGRKRKGRISRGKSRCFPFHGGGGKMPKGMAEEAEGGVKEEGKDLLRGIC